MLPSLVDAYQLYPVDVIHTALATGLEYYTLPGPPCFPRAFCSGMLLLALRLPAGVQPRLPELAYARSVTFLTRSNTDAAIVMTNYDQVTTALSMDY